MANGQQQQKWSSVWPPNQQKPTLQKLYLLRRLLLVQRVNPHNPASCNSFPIRLVRLSVSFLKDLFSRWPDGLSLADGGTRARYKVPIGLVFDQTKCTGQIENAFYLCVTTLSKLHPNGILKHLNSQQTGRSRARQHQPTVQSVAALHEIGQVNENMKPNRRDG